MADDNMGGLDALNTVDDTAVEDVSGALPSFNLAAIRAKQAEISRNAAEQAAFYKRAEDDIRARRMGPSASEQLFALSAALAKPTTVRGFSGLLGNVMPVLQQQAQQGREGEDNRTEALTKLAQAQLAAKQGLLGKELDTEVALARIGAATAKANEPKMTYAEGEWRTQPGTGGVPPLNAKGQYVVSGKEQAASVPKGRQFVLAGDTSGKVYYGQ